MKKSDLVEAIASKAGVGKGQAQEIIEDVFELRVRLADGAHLHLEIHAHVAALLHEDILLDGFLEPAQLRRQRVRARVYIVEDLAALGVRRPAGIDASFGIPQDKIRPRHQRARGVPARPLCSPWWEGSAWLHYRLARPGIGTRKGHAEWSRPGDGACDGGAQRQHVERDGSVYGLWPVHGDAVLRQRRPRDEAPRSLRRSRGFTLTTTLHGCCSRRLFVDP